MVAAMTSMALPAPHPAPWPGAALEAVGLDAAKLAEAVRFAAAQETP
jgi:hypothetical protein